MKNLTCVLGLLSLALTLSLVEVVQAQALQVSESTTTENRGSTAPQTGVFGCGTHCPLTDGRSAGRPQNYRCIP
jgi:hypothetical protein